mgnify:CR=1 FL=1
MEAYRDSGDPMKADLQRLPVRITWHSPYVYGLLHESFAHFRYKWLNY